MVTAAELFKTADWGHLTLQLVKYAVYRVRRLEWKTGSFLPKGILPEDLALDAIRKTCEGLSKSEGSPGVRLWDPVKSPDLLAYLRGVVDSDVHALVTSLEHRLNHYSPDLTPHEAAAHSTRLMDTSQVGGLSTSMAHSSNAEELLISREAEVGEEKRLSQLMKDLYRMCGDDEEELLILAAYQEAAKKNEKVKPALVAKYAGLDEKVARNAMRRLSRKVERRRFGYE